MVLAAVSNNNACSVNTFMKKVDESTIYARVYVELTVLCFLILEFTKDTGMENLSRAEIRGGIKH